MGVQYGTKDGISYEFNVAPEHLIIKQSENVFAWYSTLKYYFQNNKKGSIATLHFGEGNLIFHYQLTKISDIRDLSDMLKLAIKSK